MCICFPFQQNSKVGLTVWTCICNAFECNIYCKIYTYLLHLCYIRCKLRCWNFVARLHRFLFPKSAFSWIGHPIKIYHAVYICKKKKKNVALQVSELFFNCILLSTINLIWWKKNEFKFFLDSLTIFLNKFLIRQFFWINFIKLLLSDYTDVSFGVLVTYLSLTKST